MTPFLQNEIENELKKKITESSNKLALIGKLEQKGLSVGYAISGDKLSDIVIRGIAEAITKSSPEMEQKTADFSLQGILNQMIEDDAEDIMKSAEPSLRYRTGRLAASGRVVAVNEGSVWFTYMMNPYATFQMPEGRQATRERDPRFLFARALAKNLIRLGKNADLIFAGQKVGEVANGKFRSYL